MDISTSKQREYVKRLLASRIRILMKNGFYGLLLMHVKFALDIETDTAYTDGERIAFSPEFLDKLNDKELDFILMHEILHIALKHCFRGTDKQDSLFNAACDIVVNSNILKENGMDLSSITIFGDHVSMHLAPNGKEGYQYSAEEVYEQLVKKQGNNYSFQNGNDSSANEESNGDDEKDEKIGDSSNKNKNNVKKNSKSGEKQDGSISSKDKNSDQATIDNHDKWDKAKDNDALKDTWENNIVIAAESVLRNNGSVPLFAERLLKEIKKSKIDWRTVLNNFIQDDIVDYSFTPPDSRYDDTGFFLPSFSEKDEKVEDVLFMIDTSGSVSDEEMTAAYSEVKGAIDQFDGKLKGWLGFFDGAVKEPKEFEDQESFKKITPRGGGGTSFERIFTYIRRNMEDRLPKIIVILTDGGAEYPSESAAMGIPVLWVINNDFATPPWGKIARLELD